LDLRFFISGSAVIFRACLNNKETEFSRKNSVSGQMNLLHPAAASAPALVLCPTGVSPIDVFSSTRASPTIGNSKDFTTLTNYFMDSRHHILQNFCWRVNKNLHFSNDFPCLRRTPI
jgi:hypothetical protein